MTWNYKSYQLSIPVIGKKTNKMRPQTKIIALLSTLAFISSFCNAQVYISGQNTNPTMAEYQIAFDKWANGRDLSETKGWKWYKRWEEEAAKNTVLNGKITHPAIFYREAMKVAEQKKNSKKAGKKATWSAVGPDTFPSPGSSYYGMGRINCIAFHPTDTNTLWIGVAQGGVWKTTNGGDTWTVLTDDLPIIRISDIAVHPTNPDTIYICVGDYAYLGVGLSLDARKRNSHYGIGVYKTVDGGATWQQTGLNFQLTDSAGTLMRRVFIHRDNPDTLVAAGISGIWKSYDAGSSWTQIHDSVMWDIEYDPSNSDVLYASGGYIKNFDIGSAGIMKSTDFGSTWTWLNTGIPAQLAAQRVELAIAPSNPNYIYAIACNMNRGFYGLYRSIDGGTTWTNRSSSPNILEWYGGGGSGGQGTYDLSLLVDPNDENRIFAGGVNMWVSSDGGLTWNGVSSWWNQAGTSLHADQHQFQYNPVDGNYYVCNDAGVYKTDSIKAGSWDDFWSVGGYEWPTNWEFITTKLQITSFYRIGFCDAYPEYLVTGAQDNGTFFKTPNSWSQIYGGDGMDCLVHPTDTNTLYVSSQYGNLQMSWDGGQSFNNIKYSSEDGEWTTPMLLDPNNSDLLYAGYGNVLRYNFGWTPISNFPDLVGLGSPNLCSALDISISNSNVIYVAKRIYHQYNAPSEVHMTDNGGTTWTDITAGLPDTLYPTALSIDDTDPMTAWVTYGGFVDSVKVFKTTDGGSNWTNISGNLPNVPVNTIINQMNTQEQIVYVGTDLGVYFTSDTSSQWYLYSDGLPNVIVSEVKLDTLNNELYATTFGRGVWKTTSLAGTPCTAPAAPASVTGPDTVCSGSLSLSFSADTVGGALSYQWTVPSGWSITSGGSSDSIAATAGTAGGNICVAAVNSCGPSVSTCFSVTVKGVPTFSTGVTGPATSCALDTAVFSVQSLNADSFAWVIPSAGTIISGQGLNSLTVLWGDSAGSVCVSAFNECGENTAICTTVDLCTSIDQLTAHDEGILIYPNPVSEGSIIIQFTAKQNEQLSLKLVDALGRVVFTQEISVNPGETLSEIDIDHLVPGEYFVELVGESYTLSSKFMRQ